VWVGDGERRKRYVLCFNPQEAERQAPRHGIGAQSFSCRCAGKIAAAARRRLLPSTPFLKSIL
jgi:hypothetical protein